MELKLECEIICYIIWYEILKMRYSRFRVSNRVVSPSVLVLKPSQKVSSPGDSQFSFANWEYYFFIKTRTWDATQFNSSLKMNWNYIVTHFTSWVKYMKILLKVQSHASYSHSVEKLKFYHLYTELYRRHLHSRSMWWRHCLNLKVDKIQEPWTFAMNFNIVWFF